MSRINTYHWLDKCHDMMANTEVDLSIWLKDSENTDRSETRRKLKDVRKEIKQLKECKSWVKNSPE